jgi:hypothetical protein
MLRGPEQQLNHGVSWSFNHMDCAWSMSRTVQSRNARGIGAHLYRPFDPMLEFSDAQRVRQAQFAQNTSWCAEFFPSSSIAFLFAMSVSNSATTRLLAARGGVFGEI